MARVFSEETIFRMRTSAQRRWASAGKPPVEIPAWVPMKLRDEYRRKVRRVGEESAASWARKAKASIVNGGKP